MSYVYPGNPGGMHHHGGPPTSLAGGPPPPPPGHVTNSAPPPSGHGAGGVYGGMPYRPQYPLLPNTGNSLSSGVQQMSIRPPPGGSGTVQPPLHQPFSSGQMVSGHRLPGQELSGHRGHPPPPPTKTGPPLSSYSTPWASEPRPSSGHSVLGLPPPPPTQPGMSYNSGVRMPPPPTLGQPLSSGQPMRPPSSGQPLSSGQHPISGQPLRPPLSGQPTLGQPPTSGHVSGWVQGPRPGLLPTPPTSGQALLPTPPTSGQGLLLPPPQQPSVSGHGILPPQGQGGLLLPPTRLPISGQGLLPSPGHLPPPPPRPPTTGATSTSRYPMVPPPPGGTSGSGVIAVPGGQGLLTPPPPSVSGQPPPPPPSQPTGLAPPHPPMSSMAPPPSQPYMVAHPPNPHPSQPHMVAHPPNPHPSQPHMVAHPPNPHPSQPHMVAHPPNPHPSQPHMVAHPPNPHPSQPPQKPQATPVDPELRPVNIMEARQVMPPTPLVPPKISLPGGLGVFNPPPHIMTCTMGAVPTTSSLLGKMKLPLAIHIHPYKDVSMHECPVIHPSTIIRCRVCRAYISPFVVFIDSRHWRCNLCFRPNALPDDFDYNPQTGRRGDKSMRMEIKRSSVEYIASSEYMLRPPQPCVYYFIIDVSYNSVNSGVLALTCRCLLDCLGRLPGDARTLVGFLTVDSSLHFYNLSVGNSQPQMMVVSDVDDVYLPSPDSLLVNLKESKDMIRTLLEDLPGIFAASCNTQCALGAALQVAEKLLHSIGGRVTVIQTCLPTIGPGALKNRDVNPPATKKDTLSMAPASDFYKKLALDLSSQQIAVDLFAFSSSQFIDLSTISCVSKFSSGQIFYYPDFHHSQPTSRVKFEKDFTRYLTRKIGFEAVMRIRCTEGISLHTFHGNFFVRSTDLLSLPNTNPDHGYTISLSIDENLKDNSNICCQAALLYTSCRGERRIRVHTICLPVSSQPSVLYSKLNVAAITGVLANMAVDRATSSSIGDARDALMNTVVDCTKMYRSQVASANSPPFTLPSSLATLPLFVLSLLKNPAFTLSSRTSYDVRAQTMNLIKSTPLSYLMPTIYPSLYALHSLTEQNVVETESGDVVVQAPRLQLSPENTSRYGVFLLDCGHSVYIWVSSDAPDALISKIFGVTNFEAIPEDMTSLPVLDTESSRVVHMLLKQIRLSRQHPVSLLVIRERSHKRLLFVERLLDGKTDDGTSYYEFISHILRQLGK